ncbi:unnamed protein product [Arctia plantaginis]|uniref:Uncharacterized protein n=1 Tax=Arctia plantaginis TaxID=874455 RepID=A0A8S1BR22_ARCPL|nr:unnamed protein product [Arctia plantaginis]
MVAVVRSLKDSGLAVTVVDGDKRYTLIPNGEMAQRVSTGCQDTLNYHCNSSAQAVDGRYTSTYQAAHCNMSPTSPTVQVDEFPPQRPKGCARHGNFEVGGAGSGEAHIPVKKPPVSQCAAGTDKGAPGCNCSPQNSFASRQFVSSLRKYPCLSPERSTEIVERLITYSPTKQLSGQSTHRTQYSPTRLSDDYYAQDRVKSPTKSTRDTPGEHDIATRIKKIERSTREKRLESAGVNGDFKIPREYEVRYIKEIPKRVTNCARVPNRSTNMSPTPKGDLKAYDQPNNFVTSVDTESQAAVMMVSREVSTVTRPAPSRRTVAVPLTPSPSAAKDAGECSCVPCSFSLDLKFSKTILSRSNFLLVSPKSVQTICSCIELRNNHSIVSDDKRSKSHHHLRITYDDFRWDALELLEEMSFNCIKKPRACHKLIDKGLDVDKYKTEGKNSYIVNVEGTNYCNNAKCIDKFCKSNKGNDQIESPWVILEQKLDNVIKNWLNKLNLQVKNLLDRSAKRDSILNSTANEIKSLVLNEYLSESELKSEILKVMEGIPFYDCSNMKTNLNKPTDVLLNQIHSLTTQVGEKKASQQTELNQNNKKKTSLTDSNVKNLIEDVLLEFLEKSGKHMSVDQILSIEDELVDVLVDSIDYIRYGIDSHIRLEVQNTVMHVGEITNQEAYVITKKLLHRLQEILNDEYCRKTYTIFPVPCNKDNTTNNTNKDNDSILPIDEEDLKVNLDHYTSQISEQINEWLIRLNLGQFQDKALRQVVANDLAGEIIDRHNYLELNPNSRGTDVDELEQLKFQIFKWINKLVGESVSVAIDHAQDLMDKIRSVPVPMLVDPQRMPKVKYSITNITNKQCESMVSQHNCNSTRSHGEKELNIAKPEGDSVHPSRRERLNHSGHDTQNESNMRSTHERQTTNQSAYSHPQHTRKESQSNYTQDGNVWVNNQSDYKPTSDNRNSIQKTETTPKACQQLQQSPKSITIPPCCTGKEISLVAATLKKLNEEYDNYVQQWLLSIPIPATNPEEQKNADLARLNIYSGIWKAITKLKFDPKIYNNPYYYHDVLDDEIEKLLQTLPNTKELLLIKHKLKEQLIQNTVNMNEEVKAAAALSCYKQQLLDNLDNHLPKKSKLKIEEELNKNDLIDDYLLFTTYKQDNDVTGNVYRNSFLKNIEKLADSVKKNHGEEFRNIDYQTYVNELINAVSKVPVPDSDAIKEEACEILIQKEVDSWLTDLPLKASINPIEKRSLRNVLANKISDIGKRMNLSDCNARKELQTVLPKYLVKLPLNNNADLKFLIEELVNRLRKMPKQIGRKSVSFQMPQNYEDFSRHMPGCSSFLGPSRIIDESSYMIIAGEIVTNPEPKNWINFKQPPIPEEQWESLEQTAAPSDMLDWSQRPSRDSENHYESSPPVNTSAARGQPESKNWINFKQPPIPEEQWESLEQTAAPSDMLDWSQRPSRDSENHYGSSPPANTSAARGQPTANEFPENMNNSRNISYTSKYAEPDAYVQNSRNLLSLSRKNSSTPKVQHKPRLQQMAGAGLGVLGTSQVAGSSGVSACNIHGSVQSPRDINSHKEPKRSLSPATKDIDTEKCEFYLSTDSKGIKQMIDEKKKRDTPRQSDAETITCPYEMGPILNPVECAGGCHYIPKENNFLYQRSHYCLPRQCVFQDFSNGSFRCQRGQRSDDLRCDTGKNRDRQESRYSITSVQKSHPTNIIKKSEKNFGTVESGKDKYIPIKRQENEDLIETWKVQDFEMSSLSSKEYSQAADTKFIHTLDDTTKINFPSFNNLTLSENGLQKNDKYFLRKSPNVIFDVGKEVVELPQVPENIKKKTVRPGHDTNTVDNTETKYYSRHVIDNLKIVVKKWLKIFNIKRKDEFGGLMNDRDVYNYLVEKLEPITLDRAESDTDYKKALKLNITIIVNDLSLSDSLNSTVIDTLVNEIIAIEGKIPIRYIQPTDAEIKQFIKDEIIFVMDKSCMKINPPKMKELENKLIDNLLDLTEIEDINDNVMSQISNAFEDIAKIPGDKAKYFTKIILIDYKDFFFRQNFFSRNDNKKMTVPGVNLEFPNKIDSTLMNQRYFEQYINQIAKEIKKWFTELNIQVEDSEMHVKKLACDIIDRQKFLAKHPNMKGTISEELEHLKYQIFKRTCKLVGKNTLVHVEDLIKRINFLPNFSFNSDNKFLEAPHKCSYEHLGPVMESLTNLIGSWFHKLPIDVNSVGDTSFNRQLINILAEDIEKCINSNKLGTIDEKIDKWVKEIFKNKLSSGHTLLLKNKILVWVKNNVKNWSGDSERENNIRTYKSIINDWINTFSLQLNKEDYFVCNRNKYVHELATKIYESINGLTDQSPLVDIYNTLREDILEWMKILPLDEQSNKCRDKYAVILVTNIKLNHIGDANATESKQSDQKFLMSKLENAMLDCIINTPENTKQSKYERNTITFNDLSLYHSTQDDSLEANVEAWLNKLPIRVTDFVYFKIKKNTFIENIKLLRTLGATDEIIINEIIKFMKTLPMAMIRPQDSTYKKVEGMALEDDYLKTKLTHDDTAEMIEFTIQKWAERLSLPTFNNKKISGPYMTSLIDKVVPLICKLMKQLEQNLNEKHSQLIRNEIIKFLERFPQKRIPEQAVMQLSKCLTRKLKCIIKKKTTADIDSIGNIGKTTIDNDEIEDNLEIYATQIVDEISNWLNNFLRIESDEFNVMLNDFADDIINKEIYLNLNPQCQRSFQGEMEKVQFQILEDTQKIDTITFAQDFVKQVKNKPCKRLFAKDSQVYMQSGCADAKEGKANTLTARQEDNGTSDGKSTCSRSFSEMSRSRADNNRSSSEIGTDNSVNNKNTHASYQNAKESIFEKYQTIFKNKVSDLPIYAPTPESKQLSELARTGIYNAIMKTFFTLKSDQELENDYGYFELILEDKLDEMLDLLPQTEEMKKIRHGWKVSVLSNAINMLKEMQDVSDRPSFRQRLKDGFNRKFAKKFELEQCFLLQQGFLAEMAEAYILETKYKEDDPLKANIYKQRLMKKVDEMANHLTRQHNVDFRYLKKTQLMQHAMKILAEVPIPNEDILNDEVEEILLAEEIEQWYKELPVTPYINDFDQVFRKRMMNILAQKIHEIDKNNGELHDSKEREIKHEISNFLTERGRLERDKDLNINFMVDELNNRLKNRRLKDTTNYDIFEKKRPVSSTFAKLDNTEILAPLIDASTDTINQSYQTRDQRLGHGPTLRSNQQPRQGHVCCPQHQNIGQDQLSDQKPVPYSNGIPFQWPAEPDKSTENVAQDSQATGIPRIDIEFDPGHQYNIKSSSPLRGNSLKSNLEMNRVNRQGRQRENIQERGHHEIGVGPHQCQCRTSQRTDARGTKSLSPKYMPEPAQGYTNRRRQTYPEIRGPKSASPCRNNMCNFKPKPDLESNCLKQRQARKRTSPPSSANANSEINRPNSQGSQKSAQSRTGNVIADDDQNQDAPQEVCMPQGIIRCHPNCKQIPHQGYGQRQAEESNKPKIIVKCQCPKDFDKVKCMCFDSQPCPCKLIIKPFQNVNLDSSLVSIKEELSLLVNVTLSTTSTLGGKVSSHVANGSIP